MAGLAVLLTTTSRPSAIGRLIESGSCSETSPWFGDLPEEGQEAATPGPGEAFNTIAQAFPIDDRRPRSPSEMRERIESAWLQVASVKPYKDPRGATHS